MRGVLCAPLYEAGPQDGRSCMRAIVGEPTWHERPLKGGSASWAGSCMCDCMGAQLGMIRPCMRMGKERPQRRWSYGSYPV